MNILVVDQEKCTRCKLCIPECPVHAITLSDENKIAIGDSCTRCETCLKICPVKAIIRPAASIPGTVECPVCPVKCEIPEGKLGACHRFENVDGKLRRTRPLLIPKPPDWERIRRLRAIEKPLISGIGSKYRPGAGPAPYIVEASVEGVDVVTCVSEAELSYVGPLFTILDTNEHIGAEGAKIKRDGFHVGDVGPQIYQSQMLLIGSPTMLALGKGRFTVARTMVDVMNGRKVKLDIENGPTLEIQLGSPPVINGEASEYTGGCGSYVIEHKKLKELGVDEEIDLAIPITGLNTLHWSSGAKDWSGVMVPYENVSTPGRYHLRPGRGWGKTWIENPADAIAKIDRKYAKIGAKILVHEPSGQKAALFQITKDGFKQIELTSEVKKALEEEFRNIHEKARVSALLLAGASGGVRDMVTKFPLKLVECVHNETVKLTAGGATTYILPGRGINFAFDVEKVLAREFTYVPTPALVLPIEFTMEKRIFEYIGGYMNYLKRLSDVQKNAKELKAVEEL